jgi:cyanate permease
MDVQSAAPRAENTFGARLDVKYRSQAVQPQLEQQTAPANDPRAPRMGAIAWLSHNVAIGSIFGTSGVLLIPMQERLQVSRGLASIAIPMVMIGSAILAAVAGELAARFSLRRLLVCSAILMVAAWLVLAGTTSYPAYLIAYGLLLGPAMAIAGAVLPPTIVTRWFQRGRGLAIGIVHLPIVITLMPLIASLVIQRWGLTTLFAGLAIFAAVALVPASVGLIEYPPSHEQGAVDAGISGSSARSRPALSVPQLARSGLFWLFAIAVAAPNTSSVTLAAHLPAMGASWGYSVTSAAALASIMSLLGMAGSILFGLVADRIGGARTLALIAIDDAVLWTLLLFDLPYPARMAIIGLIGMHGSGAIPALSKALASAFGEASFSRAFGLASTLSLPLIVGAIVGFGAIFQARHSYVPAMLGMVDIFLVAVALAIWATRLSQAVLAAPRRT